MRRPAVRRLLLASTVLACAPAPAAASGATVIVKYRSGTSHAERAGAARRAGVRRTVGSVRGQGARVVTVRGSAATVARRLRESGQVAYAEPNARLRATRSPDDPLFRQLGGLAEIHAQQGWSALGLGGFPDSGGAPVGIVDTGIDASHEDLRGHVEACATSRNGLIEPDVCADDNDHGTHVAGTIAATADNSRGVAGVAFSSPLVICKALDGSGSGSIADVASCISWVHDKRAKVISMSLGGSASTTLRTAVRAAWARGSRTGSVLVAAAGNDGTTATEFPAGYPEVVSVAAVDDRGRHADFSNVNADVELAAPGVRVLSTKRGGGYVRFSGTSMATPHVAGAAALLWGAHPSSTAATVRSRLDAAVLDRGPRGRDATFGWGVLDLAHLEG
jgi:thermitase